MILLSLLLLPSAWALTPAEQLKQFDQILASHPEKIWAEGIDTKLKSAIHDYDAHQGYRPI
jgi:hypothetical protein